MVRYLSLISFTDRGIREASSSLQRAGEFRAAVEAKGGRVLSQYWALGDVDGCVVFECANDTTAASLLLKLAHGESVRTNTMRVFDASEFQSIVAASE